MSVSAERSSPALAVGSVAFLGLVGLLIGAVVGLIVISIASAFIPITSDSPLTSALSLVGQGIGLVGVAVVYLRFRDLPWSYLRISRPTLRDLGWAVAATVGLFAVLAGASFLIDQLGLTATEHSVSQQAESNPALLLPLIPLSVLVTGPAEELLYRGVIQTRLREVFGSAPAVAVAAVVFSLVHIPAYGATSGLDPSLATTLGILFLLGASLGAAYEHTENLVVPAVAHGVYNAVVFGSSYANAVGLV
ncbi:CPBP family intramembrane glutamic endopeptidase [Natronomonas gomsonensis]|uniref:CPBP family intramembrane glutamic endopeptidase n=1 Tax=Natronomonas gomsonensis TaxID=1046043 RepID=UPI0015B9D0F5|nr:type II CAAX endopeptidase family protein [Natronomonas gomsonensis]